MRDTTQAELNRVDGLMDEHLAGIKLWTVGSINDILSNTSFLAKKAFVSSRSSIYLVLHDAYYQPTAAQKQNIISYLFTKTSKSFTEIIIVYLRRNSGKCKKLPEKSIKTKVNESCYRLCFRITS